MIIEKRIIGVLLQEFREIYAFERIIPIMWKISTILENKKTGYVRDYGIPFS